MGIFQIKCRNTDKTDNAEFNQNDIQVENKSTDKDEHIFEKDVDKLGITKYVDGFSQYIKECSMPKTITIEGDWGSGKTTFINLVQENLSQDNSSEKIKSIFFNSWQYSQFNMKDDLTISLIFHLINNLDVGVESRKKIASKLFKALRSIVRAVDIPMINKEVAVEAMDTLLQDQSDGSKDMNQLSNDLNKIINDSGYCRIVIFIDDLDRLEPKIAVELLEILTLFLRNKKCVFVLAIDYNVVKLGVIQKYGYQIEDKYKTDKKVKEFFEKIVQVSYVLPTDEYNTDDYVEKVLEDIKLIEKSCTKEIESENNQKCNDEKIEIKPLEKVEIDSIKEMIKEECKNPRKIARILEEFKLDQYLYFDKLNDGKLNDDKKRIKLFIILYLKTFYESIYRYIRQSTENMISFAKYVDNGVIDDTYIKIFDVDELLRFLLKKEVLFKILKCNSAQSFFEELDESFDYGESTFIETEEPVKATKPKQNHTPNLNVQYAIRKIFNKIVDENHFDISKKEDFGKEESSRREVTLLEGQEFNKLGIDKVRLTRGKGQGLELTLKEDKYTIYFSGDYVGTMMNDGISLFGEGKRIDRVRSTDYTEYSAEVLGNDGKFDEFFEKLKDDVRYLISKIPKIKK